MTSIDELWLVDFGPPHPAEPARRRPAVIVGPPEAFGERTPFVIVVPLTTKRRRLSVHVAVPATAITGLAVTSNAQCELVRSVSRDRLVHRLGVLGPDEVHRIREVLGSLMGLGV